MSPLKYVLTFRWANQTSQLSGYLSAIALIGATGAIVHGVASRYFFGHPTIWQTEFSIYLLMLVTFVGAAYGLRHHAHVGVDLVVELTGRRTQLVLRLVSAVLSLAVVLVVLWTATRMWWEAYQGGWTSSTAWRAPLSVVYLILPVGMVLVVCQYLAFIIEALQALLGRIDHEPALLKVVNPEAASVEVMDTGAADTPAARAAHQGPASHEGGSSTGGDRNSSAPEPGSTDDGGRR